MSDEISKDKKDLWTYYKELDARVKRLEGNQNQFDPLMPIKMPPTGPVRFGPVLSKAKPTPTDEELVEKYHRIWKNFVRKFVEVVTLATYDETQKDILRQLIKDVKK